MEIDRGAQRMASQKVKMAYNGSPLPLHSILSDISSESVSSEEESASSRVEPVKEGKGEVKVVGG